MIKKFFSVLLILLPAAFIHAQVLTSFPTEKDKFIKTVDQLLKASKAESLMAADEEFNKYIKDGSITDAELQQIIETINVLAPRNLQTTPYYFQFFSVINSMAKNKLGADKMANWLKVCAQVAKGQKKGDNKDLSKFLEFSIAMYEFNAMHHAAGRTWKTDAKTYTLSYEGSGKAAATFSAGKLTGSSTTDTLYIYNTAGTYIPSEDKWYGKGGKVDWTRNKMSANSVYASFKSDYVIDFEKSDYTVDSVEFYFKEFFQTPLYGRFTDKFVSGGNDSAASYPRFNSSARNITLKEIVPNATYVGGFGLWGGRVMGVGVPDTPASVTFYRKDKKRALTAYSQAFTIHKGEEVSSPKAEVMIFNGNDTIYHPQLTLTYKAKSNEVKMLRGESGISKSKFFDSYHNHEFEVDAIIWNLDSSRMQLRTLNGVGQVGSIFESYNYFNKERIRKIQGGASYEPLSIIKKLYEKTGSKQLNANDLAKAIDPHLTEEQAKSLYYELVENGFIKYDEAAGIVTMRDKVINYVMSNSKKVDYDIIRIKSVPKDGIDYIDLKDNSVELKGAGTIPISDTAGVVIFPANKTVKIEKDRNMEFGGMVYGGRLDFFGKDYKFQYAPFTIDLNNLDSMRINIPDSGKVDEYGQPKLITLLTDIVGVKGLLEIDAPINKSGRTRLSQFPKLTTKEKSYASYEDPQIAGGAYKRKEFFFEIDPFKLDSLNSFTPSVINWAGKLVSGGIFPDIKNNLHIMPDLSLGFEISTPDAGLDLYKDASKDGSKYEGGVTLNHKGLSGKGKIQHLTASFTSEDIMFYPDSMGAVADTFQIAKTQTGVNTPEVSSAGNVVFWKPKSDSMLIYMKNKPFAMYENQTAFKGTLLLRGSGLRGNGLLDWKEADIVSKDFHFRADDLAADTAALSIKSASGDKVTFKTPNVNAKIDFKGRVGDFKTNTPKIPTEFAYNNFKTDIGEFKWYIDQKILDFNVPKDSKGEYFTSTNPTQLGLRFLARRATYNLETSILRVEQIPFINIADAKIVPDSGVVTIQGEAKIDQLKNATIYVDTATQKHTITNCRVDIISKAELRGSGDYMFSCRDHQNQKITFNDIKCTKETISEKKEKFSEYSLGAKGNVGDSANPFYIYPNVTFTGEANLYGRNPYLFMKGFAKINFKNPDLASTDFKIIDDINPDKLFLHFDSATKASDGAKVVSGIYFNKSGELPTMYHALFTQIQNHSDACLFKTSGVVTYDEKTKEYILGDEDRVVKGTLEGNLMKYNDDKGIIKGEGKMSLGADFGVIKSIAAGTLTADIKKKEYTFNLTFGLDLKSGNKSLDEKFEAIMANDNTDLPDINYEGDKFKMTYTNLATPGVDDKLIKDLDAAPIFKRPKDFPYYFVFSDVNFIYDADDLTLRSYGKIGVAMVGEKPIHKRLDGFIEIGLKNNNINIYFKTGANEWFFFEYKPGTLGLISSYDDYNRIVGTIIMTPSDKRKITGEKGQSYVVNIGSNINKGAFLDAMKDKSNPLLPVEKIKPKLPKDSSAIKKAPRGADAPVTPSDTAKAAAPKTDNGAMDSTKGSGAAAPPPMNAAQRRAAKLRGKAGQPEQEATPPAQAPAADTAAGKQQAPAQPPAAPTPAPADTSSKSAPVKPQSMAPPATTPVDTSAKTAPVKQVEVPQPKPVAPAVTAPVDTSAKAAPVKQAEVPQPKPVAPAVTTPVDTSAKAAPVKQAEVPQPKPVVPPVTTPPVDTSAKAPVKQAEVPQPKPVTPPVNVPVDTSAKAAPPKQSMVVPPPVAAPPLTAPADTSMKSAAVKQTVPVPVTPSPVPPVDSSAIKQQMTMPADTSGHK